MMRMIPMVYGSTPTGIIHVRWGGETRGWTKHNKWFELNEQKEGKKEWEHESYFATVEIMIVMMINVIIMMTIPPLFAERRQRIQEYE